MDLIPGICTQCGATLSVSKEKDAMVCPYCGTPFVVKKAIQNFNTTYHITNHISAQNVYMQNETRGFQIVGGILQKYTGADIDVVIPEGVLKIGSCAFIQTMIRSVNMPNCVVEIDSSAFSDCKNLQSVIFSDRLERIGTAAFKGCTSLTTISLPAGLKALGGDAFGNCTNLETVYLPSGLLRSKEYDKSAFACWQGRNEYDDYIYENCPKLRNIYVDGKKLKDSDVVQYSLFPYTKAGGQAAQHIRHQKEQKLWRSEGRCQHCGGRFSGLFTPKCVRCKKPRDY